MPTVYLETTIPSYLTSRPSSDIVTAAKQLSTKRWWDSRRSDFQLCVSQIVIREASAGDMEAASRRLDVISDLPRLPADEKTDLLAERLASAINLPSKALADAAHPAVCIFHSVDYLLTWNCTHIHNASNEKTIRQIASQFGYQCPTICTPEELQ